MSDDKVLQFHRGYDVEGGSRHRPESFEPMTEVEREAFYDAVIAPALKDLNMACGRHGLNFLAIVEYAPSSQGYGLTRGMPTEASEPVRMFDIVVRNNANPAGIWREIQRRAQDRRP